MRSGTVCVIARLPFGLEAHRLVPGHPLRGHLDCIGGLHAPPPSGGRIVLAGKLPVAVTPIASTLSHGTVADARKTRPFGWLTGQRIRDGNLLHLAPLVRMKFRGLDHRDEQLRRKVTKGALANYVANSGPDGIDHGLESRPLVAFAVCYVAAPYVLDLIDEQEAEAILGYCEDHLD